MHTLCVCEWEWAERISVWERERTQSVELCSVVIPQNALTVEPPHTQKKNEKNQFSTITQFPFDWHWKRKTNWNFTIYFLVDVVGHDKTKNIFFYFFFCSFCYLAARPYSLVTGVDFCCVIHTTNQPKEKEKQKKRRKFFFFFLFLLTYALDDSDCTQRQRKKTTFLKSICSHTRRSLQSFGW